MSPHSGTRAEEHSHSLELSYPSREQNLSAEAGDGRGRGPGRFVRGGTEQQSRKIEGNPGDAGMMQSLRACQVTYHEPQAG